MKETTVYVAEKFFPPRCPACQRRFSSPEDFGTWAGNAQVASFAAARGEQAASLPELYSTRRDGVVAIKDRFHADFIICLHCENKTLRMHYGSQQVLSREQADRLVREAGFTLVREARAFGTAAVRRSVLSFLGSADLGRLQQAVTAARATATETTEGSPEDAFERYLPRPQERDATSASARGAGGGRGALERAVR